MAASLDKQGVEEQEALTENRGRFMFMHTHICVKSFLKRSRTLKSEPVVAHSIIQILPHYIFHVLQRLRFQWSVKTCPLRTVRQRH